MNPNYALVLAIAAPAIDFLYGLSESRYWKNRMVAFNDILLDEPTINHFVERATIINSQLRFLGWWVVSILGTLINSYESRGLTVVLIIALLPLGALWFYFYNLGFHEIRGWRKYIPLAYRLIGYGVAIAVAVAFPKY